MAKLTLSPLKSIIQTGSAMQRLVETYFNDVLIWNHLDLYAVFNLVKNLPYFVDAKNIEIIHRPILSLNPKVKYRDCDDKAVLLGAWLYLKEIPFRFVAVSNRPDRMIHHVLIQAKIDGQIKILDATYPKNRIFRFKPIFKFSPITPWIIRKKTNG